MENLCFLFFLGDFMLDRLIIINPAIVREPGSLMAAGPRTCYRAALASVKIGFAVSYLSSLRLIPNPKRTVP